MIRISINAFMKLPEKEKIQMLKQVCKGEAEFINLDQMMKEVG